MLGPGESLQLRNAPHVLCQEGQPKQAEAGPLGAQAASVSPACSGASAAAKAVPAVGCSVPDGRPVMAAGATHDVSVAAGNPSDPAARPELPRLPTPAGAQQLAAPAGLQATLDQQICRAAALECILAGHHMDSARVHESSAGAAASMPAPALRGGMPGGAPAEGSACESGTSLGARDMSVGAAAAGLVTVHLPRIRIRVPSASPRARTGTRGWRACFCAA